MSDPAAADPLHRDTREDLWDLVVAYATAVDRRTPEALRAVFTPDASLGTPAGRRRGIDTIVEVMASLDRFEATHHHLGQHRTWPDGEGAAGELYCQAHHLRRTSSGGTVDRVMFIRYQDAYVRTDAGWRIAKRDLAVDWTHEHDVRVQG